MDAPCGMLDRVDEVRAAGGEVELEVTNIAHGGVCVARHDGRVVFVADAIPGERVRARLTDTRHARFWRAETVAVLEASPDRRPHVWPEAGLERPPERRAGGADYGHIAVPRQRALKGRVLAEALERMAGLERAPRVESAEEAAGLAEAREGRGTRTRLRLHVDAEGRVGPYAARSHTVVPVSSLPLATPAAADAAAPGMLRPGIEAIEVVDAASGVHVLERAPGRAGRAPLVRERVDGRGFRLDADGFWQVHEHAALALTRAVRGALAPDLIDPGAANLDLYGGVGLLAAALGDAAGEGLRVTSVESSRRASVHARANLAAWRGAEAVTARVDRHLRRLEREAGVVLRGRLRAATVVLDPPRSGAGRGVVDALARLGPAQLVYVACDPVALARDLARLTRSGYALAGIRALDLFPHTHHVEAVAHLVRE